MKVLVTGGLGFIGSNLVDYIIDNDSSMNITVIDNLCSESSNDHYMRNDVEYWIDDIRNICDDKYKGNNFDVIYHLAAHARIQPSFNNPVEYFSADALGTCKVLEYARNCNARVIYAGSSSAYGGPMLNPYTFAKYTGEQLCELYNKVYGLSTVITRFFNVYGPRQPVTGAWATVVGVFEKQFINNNPLTVTGTGEQRRDFTHVDDIIRGLWSLSHNQWSAQLFNLGTGKNYSINELANFFSKNIKYIPARPGESNETLADYSDINKATGWQPYINIEDYVTNIISGQ